MTTVGRPTAIVSTGPAKDVTHKPHSTPPKLEDQAATAALYVTRHDRHNKTGLEFLDKDHKLSSAGAAASLKYANPQDLPSYPSAGLKKSDSAAGAAASLGWANQKSFEHWKPDHSASASAAAVLAQDYKMAPPWQPEQSASGAKAAVLAHRDGGKVETWQPETSTWGNHAATQAFKKYGAGGLSPVLDYGYTALGRQGSLQAATGAMSQGRRRAKSGPAPVVTPQKYPDEANAISHALSAATSAHNQGRRTVGSAEFGSVPYTNMSREMYTSHPPVAPEVEEKNRQDSIHASAVAMAQSMYSQQQAQFVAGSHAHRGALAAHGRKVSVSSVATDEVPPMRFNNLQEAAQKLAQERLAKLQDEHAKNREYRDYYSGSSSYGGSSLSPSSHRLPIRGRARRRASSDGDLDKDREQSNKIRVQMSLFSNNLTQVDEMKRKKDREALIAAAQRNVTKSLHGMDERVFAETGKVAPSLLSEWEVKAHAAAQAKSDARMESHGNHGMVHIGGGKFINQSEIDRVAQRNVQPVLDEINEKAEAERERQTALKMEQETEARRAAERKSREKESKQINKKLKQQDKDEERTRKADEKAARKEEERLSKERRRSGRSEAAVVAPTTESAIEPDAARTETEVGVEPATNATPAVEDPEPVTQNREAPAVPVPIRTSMEDQASLRMRENADAANGDEVTPMSPTSPHSGKVKNWLKTKFSRRMSKGSKSPAVEKEKGKEEGFIGGAALTGANGNANANGSTASLSSVRDVALATSHSGKAREIPSVVEPEAEEERIDRPASQVSDVSSLSTLERHDTNDDEFQEARDNFDEDLAPPPTFPAGKSTSPVRDSKFTEVM